MQTSDIRNSPILKKAPPFKPPKPVRKSVKRSSLRGYPNLPQSIEVKEQQKLAEAQHQYDLQEEQKHELEEPLLEELDDEEDYDDTEEGKSYESEDTYGAVEVPSVRAHSAMAPSVSDGNGHNLDETTSLHPVTPQKLADSDIHKPFRFEEAEAGIATRHSQDGLVTPSAPMLPDSAADSSAEQGEGIATYDPEATSYQPQQQLHQDGPQELHTVDLQQRSLTVPPDAEEAKDTLTDCQRYDLDQKNLSYGGGIGAGIGSGVGAGIPRKPQKSMRRSPRPSSVDFSPKPRSHYANQVVCFKFFFQIYLMLHKRFLELRHRKVDVVYLIIPPLIFFAITILMYQVVPILIAGGLEEYTIPLAFWVYMQKVVVTVMHEKQQGLREAMKMMGLMESSYWISYFIR
jgi:hypothetical protein